MSYDDFFGESYWANSYWGDSYWGEYGAEILVEEEVLPTPMGMPRAAFKTEDYAYAILFLCQSNKVKKSG
jgi:hypothetical protein